MTDSIDIELIYVADPMCSWCWGFSPVVSRIDGSFDVPIRIVVGGLRPGIRAQPLDDRLRPYLARHWNEIAERTGQPFDVTGLDRENWMYDTMVADTAVVAMRDEAPDDALRFFETVQRAFYADRIDVTDPAVYGDLVSTYPVPSDRFVASLTSDAVQAAARADFTEAAALGVSGFPTLLLRIGASVQPVAMGYAPYEAVADRIRVILAGSLPEELVSAVCDVDGGLC